MQDWRCGVLDQQEAIDARQDELDRKQGWDKYDQRECEPVAFVGSYLTRLPADLPYGSAYCTPQVCRLHWRSVPKDEKQPSLMEV